MTLHIDFETRSAIDISAGPWRYAEDPSTDVLCLSYAVDDGDPVRWFPSEDHGDLEAVVDAADTICAHNVMFEEAIWKYHMPFPLPIHKLRCSAATAARLALPRKLGKLCEVLGVDQEKDVEGERIMKRIARKGRKTTIDPDADQLDRLAAYCDQDVRAERAASDGMQPLPETELAIWRLDQEANRRGTRIDIPLLDRLVKIAEVEKKILVADFRSITGFNPTQTKVLADWLGLPSVGKDVLTDALPSMTGDKRKATELRLAIGKASVSKLTTAQKIVGSDGRLRDTLVFRGAATGRWSGKGMQLQNLPSRGLIDDVGTFIDAVTAGADYETLSMFYPNMMLAISSAIRGVLIASEDMQLYAADFSAIEGRVMAWLVDEKQALEDYRTGVDPYKRAASAVFRVPYDDVTKPQRQVGKVPVLSGAYGGGWRAYMSFAKQLGLAPPDHILNAPPTADDGLSEEESAYCRWFSPMVTQWREDHPATVAFWKTLEQAFRKAIRNPRTGFAAGKLRICGNGKDIAIRLPSGNFIFFARAVETGDGDIVYQTLKNGQWMKAKTYGGKLAGSVVQAIARDMMAEAMLRMKEKLNLDLLFTVHDEIVSEGSGVTLEEYNTVMEETPSWATGCPIDVDGWIGQRYRK